MSGSEEVTIREGTIFTLGKSLEGFKDLKEACQEVGRLFETGQPVEALELIKSVIIPNTNAMYGFFVALIRDVDAVLGEELTRSIVGKLKALEELMAQLENETVNGILTEVGDILQFDYFDLITEFEGMIPGLIEQFRNSDISELDEY